MAQLSRWRGWQSVTDLTTALAPELLPARSEPGLPDHDPRLPAEPVASGPDGVALARLLALVRLSAPQALEVGAGVLAEAARGEVADTAATEGDPVVLGR